MLPKIIIRSQTHQNIALDAGLDNRKTRSSLIHKNTGTSPLHQESYTTPLGADTKNNGNKEPACCKKETPNKVS